MTPLEIVSANLVDIICLPDPEAAEALAQRMAALDHIKLVYDRTYSDRVVIMRLFETKQLWKHLTDPDTGLPFPHMTAFMSCSKLFGCRRTNFEALADAKLLSDMPAEKIIDLPKGNIKVLAQLSTAVRNDPEILEAAKGSEDAFVAKVQQRFPSQHLESSKTLRFQLPAGDAAEVEEAIDKAMEVEEMTRGEVLKMWALEYLEEA
jgi:hypothetical protein